MAKIISFANHKGGVGKTTSVATIGYELSILGYNVLMIDLDPQSNLTFSFLQEAPEITIYNVFVNNIELPIVPISNSLHIVPSDLNHAGTSISIIGRMQREYILKKSIDNICKYYDFILLDCPPSLDLITINALTASDEIYIPITAEILPTKGLSMLSNFISMIKSGLNPGLKIGGIFFTKWENLTLSKQVEQIIKENYGDLLLSHKVRKNTAVGISPAYLKTVIETAPKSNGSIDYIELTKEIINRQ